MKLFVVKCDLTQCDLAWWMKLFVVKCDLAWLMKLFVVKCDLYRCNRRGWMGGGGGWMGGGGRNRYSLK